MKNYLIHFKYFNIVLIVFHFNFLNNARNIYILSLKSVYLVLNLIVGLKDVLIFIHCLVRSLNLLPSRILNYTIIKLAAPSVFSCFIFLKHLNRD